MIKFETILLIITASAFLVLFGTATRCPSRTGTEASPSETPVFKTDWESLAGYQCPEWFRDAKFGIFTTWGVYSVPARGCWYGRKMYEKDRSDFNDHIEHWGHPFEFGYKDFIPLWKAENIDPDAWLTLFKESGARSYMPCATCHDGFDLRDSPHPYNAVRMGPKKNLLKMLMDSTLSHGLRWGFTTHLARNYNFFHPGYSADREDSKKGIPYIADTPENRSFYHPNHGDNDDRNYPTNPSQAWKDSWSTRLNDLIDRYRPDLLYFDGAVPFDIDDGLTGRRVLARYFNSGLRRYSGYQQVVMFIKTGRIGHGIYRDDVSTLDLERPKLDALHSSPWQTDDTIGVRYWIYADGKDYRPVDELIDFFLDIVSKNGNLLLNIPPRADGTSDDESIRILREIGAWNRENGGAVFNSRPWIKYGEGDILFTRSKDGTRLFLLFLTWPEDGQAVIESLSSKTNVWEGNIQEVRLLGSQEPVEFIRDESGLHLILQPHPILMPPLSGSSSTAASFFQIDKMEKFS